MKNLLLWGWVLCLVLAAFPAAAQNLRVEYSEGEVQVAAGSGWKDLNPGDSLPATAKIRLAADGLLDLAQGSTRLSVSQPGTYVVADLLAAAKKVSSWQLGQVVGTKLKGAVSGTASVQGARASTAGGARAGKAGEPAPIEWVEASESDEAIADGRYLMEAGRYDEALQVFQDALKKAEAGEAGTLTYYIASVHAHQSRTALALRSLDRVKLEPQEPMYGELVLLKGQLLLESLAFNDALALFTRQLQLNPAGDFAQALLILTSYSYRGLGKNDGARESLQKAVRLNAGSELGQEASRLLSQL